MSIHELLAGPGTLGAGGLGLIRCYDAIMAYVYEIMIL